VNKAATAVICAFNEAPRVGAVVQATREADVNCIVVDDGSSDGTAEVAERLGATVVRHDVNRGKGAALSSGLKRVETPFTVLLDADLTGLRASHVTELVRPLDADRAVATRGVLVGGRVATTLAQRLVPYLSGQRGLRTADLTAIGPLEDAGYGLEVLMERRLRERGVKQHQVHLAGVAQVMKEEKGSFSEGARARLKMYSQIVWQLVGRGKGR
jgi:glycosyltransferase involved in cell wall biosynthesis